MNAVKDHKLSIEDLAGQWTESALKILKTAGLRPISVELELEVWRTLKVVLAADLRWQRMFRFSTLLSLSTLMEQSLRKATLLILRKFVPQSLSTVVTQRIGQLAEEQRSFAVKRGLYSATVRLPAATRAASNLSQSGLVPRATVAAAFAG